MAVDDAFTITGNTPQTFTFAQLLGNDFDPGGLASGLTVSGVSGAVHGTQRDRKGGGRTRART